MSRTRSAFLYLGLAAAAAGCQPSQPQSNRRGTAARSESIAVRHTTSAARAQGPDTTPPADVSHGEAPVGGTDAGPAQVPARLAPREHVSRHQVRFEIQHTRITVAPGVTYAAWTFAKQVPGPVVHVAQGDTVDFTLVNRANIPHSLDFHAAEIAPDKYYKNLMPNDSLHYQFVARVPGAFMYHCGTAPVAMHIANGMYGAIVVDPRAARPKAKEFVLVQSEFYLSRTKDKNGDFELDWNKMLSLAPDHVVFNGRAAQYATHPLEVSPNELLRLYLVNAGPNRISSFHVVGGIFERAFLDGSSTTELRGVQTVNVPVGGGGIFEVRLREPGEYPFVTHAFADATKGAVGVLRAVDPKQTASAQTGPSTMRH